MVSRLPFANLEGAEHDLANDEDHRARYENLVLRLLRQIHASIKREIEW
jgi:hypothetical protein